MSLFTPAISINQLVHIFYVCSQNK